MTSLHYTYITYRDIAELYGFFHCTGCRQETLVNGYLQWVLLYPSCGAEWKQTTSLALFPGSQAFHTYVYTSLRIHKYYMVRKFCGPKFLWIGRVQTFWWFDVGKATPTSCHTDRWRDGKQLWLMVYKRMCNATVRVVRTPLQQTAWEWPWGQEATCHFWQSPNAPLTSTLAETPLQRMMVLRLSMIPKQH